jgi:hypothetical protein
MIVPHTVNPDGTEGKLLEVHVTPFENLPVLGSWFL